MCRILGEKIYYQSKQKVFTWIKSATATGQEQNRQHSYYCESPDGRTTLPIRLPRRTATAQWCSWDSRVTNNAQKSSLLNQVNRDMANQRNVWFIWNHMVFMFLSKPASCKIVRCRDIFLCRKMAIRYLQVQMLLASVHFIQTAKKLYMKMIPKACCFSWRVTKSRSSFGLTVT